MRIAQVKAQIEAAVREAHDAAAHANHLTRVAAKIAPPVPYDFHYKRQDIRDAKTRATQAAEKIRELQSHYRNDLDDDIADARKALDEAERQHEVAQAGAAKAHESYMELVQRQDQLKQFASEARTRCGELTKKAENDRRMVDKRSAEVALQCLPCEALTRAFELASSAYQSADDTLAAIKQKGAVAHLESQRDLKRDQEKKVCELTTQHAAVCLEIAGINAQKLSFSQQGKSLDEQARTAQQSIVAAQKKIEGLHKDRSKRRKESADAIRKIQEDLACAEARRDEDVGVLRNKYDKQNRKSESFREEAEAHEGKAEGARARANDNAKGDAEEAGAWKRQADEISVEIKRLEEELQTRRAAAEEADRAAKTQTGVPWWLLGLKTKEARAGERAHEAERDVKEQLRKQMVIRIKCWRAAAHARMRAAVALRAGEERATVFEEMAQKLRNKAKSARQEADQNERAIADTEARFAQESERLAASHEALVKAVEGALDNVEREISAKNSEIEAGRLKSEELRRAAGEAYEKAKAVKIPPELFEDSQRLTSERQRATSAMSEASTAVKRAEAAVEAAQRDFLARRPGGFPPCLQGEIDPQAAEAEWSRAKYALANATGALTQQQCLCEQARSELGRAQQIAEARTKDAAAQQEAVERHRRELAEVERRLEEVAGNLSVLKRAHDKASKRKQAAMTEATELEELKKGLEASADVASRAAERPVIERLKGENGCVMVKFNEDHVYNGSVNYATGQGQLVGIHHAPSLKPQCDFTIRSHHNENDIKVYTATISYPKGDKLSTMFPDHWDKNDIARAVRCAMQRTEPSNDKGDKRKGKCLVDGTFLEIEGYPDGEDSYGTVFPIRPS